MIKQFYANQTLLKINGILVCGCRHARTEEDILALAHEYAVDGVRVNKAIVALNLPDDNLDEIINMGDDYNTALLAKFGTDSDREALIDSPFWIVRHAIAEFGSDKQRQYLLNDPVSVVRGAALAILNRQKTPPTLSDEIGGGALKNSAGETLKVKW